MAGSLKRKKTTIPTAPGVTAESVVAALRGFEWNGGPYRLEVSGDYGCFQVWASDASEADRVFEKLWSVSGLPAGYKLSSTRVEGAVTAARFQTIRRFGLGVVDGLALVSDRVGPGGAPGYPDGF